MNRTIKFRGKSLQTGEWVYGYLQQYQEKHGKLLCVCAASVRTWKDGLLYEVIPDTVGQFTGLLDKNGREVYEGDILHECVARCIVDKRIVKFCYGSFIAESTYNQGAQCYGEPHEKFQSLKYFAVNDIKIEVIGNIHDNPELLNSKQ